MCSLALMWGEGKKNLWVIQTKQGNFYFYFKKHPTWECIQPKCMHSTKLTREKLITQQSQKRKVNNSAISDKPFMLAYLQQLKYIMYSTREPDLQAKI